MDRICSVEGCGKPYYARSYCRPHYMKLAKPKCSIDGCPKPAATRGLCRRHCAPATREHPDGAKWHRQPTTCTVDECGKAPVARGWCTTHYSRWKLHGDPRFLAREHISRDCSIADCGRPKQAYGLCGMHRQRLEKHGDPQREPPQRIPNRVVLREDAPCELIVTCGDGSTVTALFDYADAAEVTSRQWMIEVNGYVVACRREGDPPLRMHRLVTGLAWNDYTREPDHINGVRSDNRRSNLRVVTRADNTLNTAIVNNHGTSRFRNVYRDSRRGNWVASMSAHGTAHYLGAFSTEEAAADRVARFREENGLPPGY